MQYNGGFPISYQPTQIYQQQYQPQYPQYQQGVQPHPDAMAQVAAPQAAMQQVPMQQVPMNVQRKVDFVQNRTSAEVYQVDAGWEVILIDMDSPVAYRKARGFDNKLEPLEIYDLVLRKDQAEAPPAVDMSGYLTSEEFERRIAVEVGQKIKEEVERKFAEISLKPTTSRKAKREERPDSEEKEDE